MPSEICYLGVCKTTVKVMGHSEPSYNLLWIEEINLRDWCKTSFTPTENQLAQLNICGRTKLFMIILERSTSIVSFYLIAIIIKRTILHDWDKYYTRLDRGLITWQSYRKSWREKIQSIKFCLISVGVGVISRILVSIKTFGRYKNCHEINL